MDTQVSWKQVPGPSAMFILYVVCTMKREIPTFMCLEITK